MSRYDELSEMSISSGLTQDGHHDIIFEDLDGAVGDKVEHGEHVSTVDQSVSRGRVGGLESHGQGPQAAFCGSLEGLAAVEQVLVKVEANICLQALGETLQHLRGKHGSGQTRAGSELTQQRDFSPGFVFNFVAEQMGQISREL